MKKSNLSIYGINSKGELCFINACYITLKGVCITSNGRLNLYAC